MTSAMVSDSANTRVMACCVARRWSLRLRSVMSSTMPTSMRDMPSVPGITETLVFPHMTLPSLRR